MNRTNAMHSNPPCVSCEYRNVYMCLLPSDNNIKNTFCEDKADGQYRDLHDCSEFYVCSFGLTFHEYCAPGTAFNEKIMTCDFPLNVPGCLPSSG